MSEPNEKFFRLFELAEREKVEVRLRGEGTHVQLRGLFLVNYYPFSAKKTAYYAGTVSAAKITNVSAEQAIKLANQVPPILSNWHRDTHRKGSTRKQRAGVIARTGDGERGPCHLCGRLLTVDESTLDHHIPLARGGLDNVNNRRICCHAANQWRGHDMRELKGETPPCDFD
jgi:hypothetical protein